MTDRERALAFLARDPLTNIDMTECLRRGLGSAEDAGGDGVLLRVRDEDTWMLAAADAAGAEARIALLPEKDCAVVCRGAAACAALARARPGFAPRPCLQIVWTRSAPDPSGPAEIRRLGAEWADFVNAHYSLGLGAEYIRGVAGAGNLYGAFVGGEAAGFIGVHAEGSMGILEVLGPFKRRGIGAQLERFLICRQLEAGFVPYGQIICGNVPSVRLAEKVGFSFAPELISWFLCG